MARPATTWSVFRGFSPLAFVASVAVGGITWAVTSDVVGFVTGFVFTLLGAVVVAWEWAPFARIRQLRRSEIEGDPRPERRSATSTTEPLVAWLRRRGKG
jgi:hypothetical protein